MSIIVISADPFGKGEEIAELAARELGYKCIDREAMLAEAVRSYRVSETNLAEALWETAASTDKRSHAQNRHLAYLKAAFFAVLGQDQTVFIGRGEHLFIAGVSHVLKVRLLADLEESLRLKVEKELISEEKARRKLQKIIESRRKWAKCFFNADEKDPALFDLVLDVRPISPPEAAARITELARDIRFQAITYSIKCLRDKELANRVRATLIDAYPDINIQARDGTVSIESKAVKKKKRDKILALKEVAENIDGVNYLEIL